MPRSSRPPRRTPAGVQPGRGHVEDDDVGLHALPGRPTAGAAAAQRPRRSGAARAWSSASRSTWWSRAYSPAAARMPTWRMPPPNRLRQIRASAISSRRPDEHRADRGAEPLGQADAHGVELACRRSRSGTPGGDVGVPEPGAVEVHRDAARRWVPARRPRGSASSGWTVPPPKLWVFSTTTSRGVDLVGADRRGSSGRAARRRRAARARPPTTAT